MQLWKKAVVLGLAVSVAGFAAEANSDPSITRQIQVDENFGDGWIRFSGLSGGYYFKMRLIAASGRLELCGVGVFTDVYSRQQEQSVLRDTKLTMNGQAILEDLSFFSRVSRRRDLDTAMANCALTSAAVPRGEAEFDIDVPTKRYRF